MISGSSSKDNIYGSIYSRENSIFSQLGIKRNRSNRSSEPPNEIK